RSFLHRRLQLRRSESGDAFGLHHQLTTAARIADAARLAMGDAKTAEAGKRDAVPARQAGLDSRQQRFQCARRLRSSEVGIERDSSDDFPFIHRVPRMGGSFIKVAPQCQGCSTSNFSWRWHCSPVLFYTAGSDRLVSQGALTWTQTAQ